VGFSFDSSGSRNPPGALSRATSARGLVAGRRRCHYRVAPCVIPCGGGISGDGFRLGRLSAGSQHERARGPQSHSRYPDANPSGHPVPSHGVARFLSGASRCGSSCSDKKQLSSNIHKCRGRSPNGELRIAAAMLKFASFNRVSEPDRPMVSRDIGRRLAEPFRSHGERAPPLA
jgi:hypothetical protein